MKILVIDDDQGILEAVKAILEFDGYEVTTAGDSEHLKSLKADKLPNLILVDLLLSGKNGKGIIKLVKENDHTKDIPIIMLSAHPDAQAAALDAGADDFLAKPFDMNNLLELVKKHIKADQ